MKRIYLIILLLLSMQSVRADFNDGVVAYLMGDYETAYNTMISLAKTSEDGLSQYYLGIMYMKGQGVEQDYEEAGKWLRQAAEKNLPQAQYKLANLYTAGNGVPQDYEFAYIWYSVAAAHKHELSIKAIETAKTKLSPEEMTAANKQIEEYVRKYGPKEEDQKQAPQISG